MARKRSVTVKRIHNVSDEGPWEFLLVEATRRLQEHEVLAARIRVAIEHYQRQKEAKAPFPGMNKIKADGLFPCEEELSA